MVPSPPSTVNRTWNFISVLGDDSHVTQPVTIHHCVQDKRPSLKKSKTSIVGHHGIIFHYQNEEPVMQPTFPSSFIQYIILTLFTWII